MCGIAAVYAPGVDVARLVYFGLYALQHRGQESAGIAVGDGERLASHREMGLLTGVFNEEILSRLTGTVAMGHTRYSTSGSSIIVNAQPFMENTDIGPFAFGHNGNLTNAEALLEALPGHVELDATSDSEILAKTIALGSASTLVERVKDAMAVAEGAYSVIMITPDSIIAFRDPWGVRPLCIGTYGDGYMVASRIVRALDRRRAVSARDRAGRGRRGRPQRDAQRTHRGGEAAGAVHVRVHLLRAPRLGAVGPLDLHGALPDGARAGARAPGRRRRGDGGARLGDPGRHRLCGRERHCRTSKD